MSQNPEVFGMDDNVDISKELQETRELFDSILITQSQHSASSSGKKTEDTLNEIATDILSKVRGIWMITCREISPSLPHTHTHTHTHSSLPYSTWSRP